ncbi:MAG: recombinase family protein [Bacillota bacterium]
MLAIIYIRVSTEDQARHGFSLKGQEDAGMEKARALGATEVLVFADEGITGEILERPGLQDALAAAKASAKAGGKVAFIVYDPDRLSRKLVHQLMLADELSKAGCQLEFVNFDWQDTPDGRLFYTLRGSIAEYEKEKFKMRSRFGKLAKAKRGLLTHNPGLYGYDYNDGQLVTNATQAEVYRHMVDNALAGASPEEIARRLNEAGVPGPRGERWYRATVRRILKNESYTGTLYLNRHNAEGIKAARQKKKAAGRPACHRRTVRSPEEWIPVKIPALINSDTWSALQDALERSRHGRRGRKVNHYLLSGILHCACGEPMHGLTSGKGYQYYACRRRHVAGYDYRRVPERCALSGYLRADQVEEAVWEKVKIWLNDPDALARDAKSESGNKARAREIQILGQQLNDLQQERDRVFAAYRRALITLEEYAKVTEEIGAKREGVEKRLRELERLAETEQNLEQGLGALKALAREVARRVDDLEPAKKEHLIRLLVRMATVRGDEIVLEARIPGTEGCCVSEPPHAELFRRSEPRRWPVS